MDVGNSANNRGITANINVTPLVDIVLVLLIIFMVLTPATLKHLSAQVPKQTEETTAIPADTSLVVSYSTNRTLTINREPVSFAAFPVQLRRRLQARREKTVFFQAADGVAYGEVVRLMDQARGVGAETLALVTHSPR